MVFRFRVKGQFYLSCVGAYLNKQQMSTYTWHFFFHFKSSDVFLNEISVALNRSIADQDGLWKSLCLIWNESTEADSQKRLFKVSLFQCYLLNRARRKGCKRWPLGQPLAAHLLSFKSVCTGNYYLALIYRDKTGVPQVQWGPLRSVRGLPFIWRWQTISPQAGSKFSLACFFFAASPPEGECFWNS